MSRWLEVRGAAREAIVPGALAGLVGGVAFGAAMVELGVLPTVASLVRTDLPVVGFVVHMTIAATVGAGLGIILRGRWGAADILFWGVAYAAFFWFVGPITLQPLILGRMPTWDIAAAQAAFPSLLGHVTWGATTGVALIAIKAWRSNEAAQSVVSLGVQAQTSRTRRRGPVFRGLVAGLVGWGAVGLLAGGSERMLSPLGNGGGVGATELGSLTVALVAAVLYALLHPSSAPSAGASLVRGAAFGYLLWVLGGLTILPVLRGAGLNWSIEDAQATFPALPGAILLGAATALVYHWLGRVARLFFSDDVAPQSADSGVWGLRALVRGAAAGLVGGLLFTLVMVQIGLLPTVARLVGSDSALVGLIVHLVIAEVVGASYGLFFRRQAFDPTSAIGWGVSYGFLWWILGPLTLAPVILGAAPAWTLEAATAAFPSLIGHLAYGAALGLTFHAFEARYSPWWITRTEAEQTRMAGRRAVATSAGPALWPLLVLVAVTLPVLLAR
ncbi:MAG: hypothetical protein ABIP53_01855 [Candidatus Limnocylindrales bacterium]